MAKETETTELNEEVVEEVAPEEALVTPDYDPTPPPKVPVSWDLTNVYVTVEGDDRDTIDGWSTHNGPYVVTLVDNEDGSVKFDFDDNGRGPAAVVVYTNGRP